MHPEDFFDLSQFAHAALFDEEVWAALDQIGPYLAAFSLGKIEGEVSPDAYLIDPHLITIGKGTVVEPGAYIRGPCLLGENCTVRHGAYIRGNFIAGNHCMIGHCTEVKNAIFLNRAQAGHFAYLGDTILGNNANLGAGFKCANLRLDHKPIHGRRKCGAIIGDNAQLGCNGVSNPGTLIAPHAATLPNATLKGHVHAR